MRALALASTLCVSARVAYVEMRAVDAELVQAAGDLAETQQLRGCDAIHLAAVVRLGPPNQVAYVACRDEDLRKAAGTLGYKLFPS
jgi:predicted nucleic acid-binding protein